MRAELPTWRLTCFLASAAVLGIVALQWLLTDWTAWLRYERSALLTGQWWRLLTAHVVHLDLRHALLNGLAAGLMIWLFASALSWRHWLLTVMLAVSAIDAGLWFLHVEVAWYVGASGVLHGVLAAGTIAWLQQGDGRGWPLLGLLVLKLGYEQLSRGALPLMTGAVVITAAHLYGAGAGALVPWLIRAAPNADADADARTGW